MAYPKINPSIKHPIIFDSNVGMGNLIKLKKGIFDNINLKPLPKPPPIKTNKTTIAKIIAGVISPWPSMPVPLGHSSIITCCGHRVLLIQRYDPMLHPEVCPLLLRYYQISDDAEWFGQC